MRWQPASQASASGRNKPWVAEIIHRSLHTFAPSVMNPAEAAAYHRLEFNRSNGSFIMLDRKKITAALPSLVLGTLTMGSIVISAVTYGDDAPPADAPQGGGGRHNNPAWAGCKKQADDQKLAPGDARHEFMRNCMKAAKAAATPPPSP